MNLRTIVLGAVVIALLVSVPFFVEDSEAASSDHNYDYEYTVNLTGTLNVTAVANFSATAGTPDSLFYDTYQYEVDAPPWISVSKGDGGGANGSFRMYTLTGIPETTGTFTVTIIESWEPLTSGWYDLVRHITTVTIHVVLSEDAYTITFDANGGEFENGSSTLIMSTERTLVLPYAYYYDDDGVEIKELEGWYNEDDELVGLSGETITVTASETYHAIWRDPDLVVSAWDVPSNQYLGFDYSPTVRDENGNIIENFTITYYDNDSSYDGTDCITPSGDTISADFHGLMPGQYTALFTISANGYTSTTWTVNVNQSVFMIDDPEMDLEVGDTFSRDFAVKPNNARISSYSVTLDGSTVPSTQYSISTSGTYVSFAAEAAGVWAVTLTFSASSLTNQVYTFYLTYYESEEPEPEPVQPSIEGIHMNKVTGEGLDNVYMFSAYGVLNATRTEWDFGDGTTGMGSSVTHTYNRIDEYTVRCTVYNGNLSAFVEITVFAEDIPTDEDFLEQANINSVYNQVFYIDTRIPMVSITGVLANGTAMTESQLEWLQSSTREVNGQYVFEIIGTCTDVTLVGGTVSVVVTGAGQVWSWDITIYPEVGTGDIPTRGYADYELSGFTVTLTDLDPCDNGIRLVVDWGDGSTSINGSAATFTHTYTSAGQKVIILTWYISTIGEQTERTTTLTVNIEGDPGVVVYIGGEGSTGEMGVQSGSYTYIVQECGFQMPGATFLGWNTCPDYTGTVFMPGNEVSPNGTLTLYAMWSGGSAGGDGDDNTLLIAAGVILVAIIIIFVWRFL